MQVFNWERKNSGRECQKARRQEELIVLATQDWLPSNDKQAGDEDFILSYNYSVVIISSYDGGLLLHFLSLLCLAHFHFIRKESKFMRSQ
jgi:hypothetical protein